MSTQIHTYNYCALLIAHTVNSLFFLMTKNQKMDIFIKFNKL